MIAMLVIVFAAGLLSGLLLFFLLIWIRAQKLMLQEDASRFSFDESIERFKVSVENVQWKLLGEHDLQAKMKANGYDVMEARVFDICKPAYASRILERDSERIVSPLMPCRVAIYRKSNGKTYFSRMNSGLMARPLKGVVPSVMGKAAADVEKILAPLHS